MSDYDVFLKRVLDFVEAQLPALAESVFGQATGLAEMRVSSFSAGDPAVNVYTAGGEFLPHTDNEALTLLVPLSPEGAFQGGGTAFWKDSEDELNNRIQNLYIKNEDGQSKYNETDAKMQLPHDHVVKGAPGTAILFGGDMRHAGLSVTAGTRHVFVMAFSLKPRVYCAPAARDEQQQEDEPLDVDSDALDDFAGVFGDY
jgi:hypothetical protein